MVEAVPWIQNHDGFAQQMATAGNTRVREILNRTHVLCYTWLLIFGYSRLFSYSPGPGKGVMDELWDSNKAVWDTGELDVQHLFLKANVKPASPEEDTLFVEQCRKLWGP